ncbi:MAG: YegS/Rv2252/BmrU family lipid kinase [Leptotrichiaceae bacterium]|nr:YegS/Rv2252/BmrU family lipid kinase [Leptotrichiaceae bacterium]
MKKSLLVYNPKSGNSDIILNNFDLITSKFLEKGITLTLYSISTKYDRLTEILKDKKYDILILAGGDGTLSRSLSQLYNENIEFPEIAIFPTGTSNDLAKSLNLGDDLEKWMDNIVNGKAEFTDFGLINDSTVFLSSYAGGLFTKVSYNTDKNLKKVIGKAAYHISGLGELANMKKFDLNITLDTGETVCEKSVLYMILNGKSVGGFDGIIDNADMSDGIMNIIIIKNIENPFDIPQIFLDLINNKLINYVYVRTLTAKSCIVEKVNEEIGVSIDGEEGKNEKAEIKFIGNRLKIFRKVKI